MLAARAQTGFLQLASGAVYLTVFTPPAARPCDHWIIHVPAFAEEMNRSRHLVAQQARAFAAQGYTVVVPDLFGTGDSEGTLAGATLASWRSCILHLEQRVRGWGARWVSVWGNRFGALLAADVACQLEQPPAQLLLWQPVVSGEQHVEQFVRLRVAAAAFLGQRESAADIRAAVRRGELQEIAGYPLAGALLDDIAGLNLAAVTPPLETRVVAAEVAREAEQPVTRALAAVLERWQASGVECMGFTCPGDPYWLTQELGRADALIAATSQLAGSAHRFDAVDDIPGASACALPQRVSESGERALAINCEGASLVAVLHGVPPTSAPALASDSDSDSDSAPAAVGVVIVVGGPQYRVGSHRQFVLLARALAAAGLPVLRFDYRGMGDSEGNRHDFTAIGADIRSAVDALIAEQPAVNRVVLWGLCDAATAATDYAVSDDRVAGLVLANPWVHSQASDARARLRYYYPRRLVSRDFWRRLLRGKLNILRASGDVLNLVWQRGRPSAARAARPEVPDQVALGASGDEPLADRFIARLGSFAGSSLVLISGRDLTASEFVDAVTGRPEFRALQRSGRVQLETLAGADHTFSTAADRQRAERLSIAFLEALASTAPREGSP